MKKHKFVKLLGIVLTILVSCSSILASLDDRDDDYYEIVLNHDNIKI